MSYRRAKRPRSLRSDARLSRQVPNDHPDLQSIFIPDDAELQDALTDEESVVLEMLRRRGRPVHVTEDGGVTSKRVGVLSGVLGDGLILEANYSGPLVLSPAELAQCQGQSQ